MKIEDSIRSVLNGPYGVILEGADGAVRGALGAAVIGLIAPSASISIPAAALVFGVLHVTATVIRRIAIKILGEEKRNWSLFWGSFVVAYPLTQLMTKSMLSPGSALLVWAASTGVVIAVGQVARAVRFVKKNTAKAGEAGV